MDMEIITLDDGKDYFEVDTLEYNGNKYLLLSEVDKVKNVCIKKSFFRDGDEYLESISDEDNTLLSEMFIDKNKDIVYKKS